MIKTGIVCGCLPAQSGIEHAGLYHQILARNIFLGKGIQLEISSIWYTTLSGSAAKVLELIGRENPGIIIYHVRPDPYLRVSKALIRFRDPSGKLRFLLNLDADDSNIREKKYPSKGSMPVRKRSFMKIIFKDMNYLAGLILGINSLAIERERKLLHEVSVLCMQQQVRLILIGPASRPGSNMENYLLNRLEKKLAGEFKNEHFRYVTCFGTYDRANEKLFMEDGVHVSEAGHKRFAELIAPVLSEIIQKRFYKDVMVEQVEIG